MNRDNEMILVDAGCQYRGYCSDITRTWPVNGRFSFAQRQIYSIVLKVQKLCIEKCTETAKMSLNEIHSFCEQELMLELIKIGFPNSIHLLQQVLFPHHVGHYLGLDLHDCSHSGNDLKLKAGMVVTMEPGLYIPRNDERFPQIYRGISVRIEDDIAVGVDSNIVLSARAPKEIDEIETIIQNGRK